jgi:chorismate synthase
VAVARKHLNRRAKVLFRNWHSGRRVADAPKGAHQGGAAQLWEDWVMLRWLTAGESHGPELIAIIEGLPSGIPVSLHDIRTDLARRKLGYGRGARMKFEQDEVTLSGGVVHGFTLGSPVAIRVGNTEWPKWVEVMGSEPVEGEVSTSGRGAPLTRPRPGHADLVGMQKYGFDEARPILERASARETAARVALGAVVRTFLAELGITLVSHTLSIGPVRVPEGSPLPVPADVDLLDADPLRCFDPETSARMVAEVDDAHKEGDTLGGVVEVLAYGLPPGLGSHVHWDRRLDSQLAGALMSIQAIKGVEVGDGFLTTTRRGSQAHDELFVVDGEIERSSDKAGGTEGGMSTGTVLRVRAGMKPIATIPHALRTVDIATGEAAAAHHQRSDVCAVPAAGVVAEAMVALVLAKAVLEKFGGDSVAETRRNLEGYLAAIPATLRTGSSSIGEPNQPVHP